jgi:hypothetical protein
MATAMGAVPTETVELGAGGIEDTDGGTATLTEEKNGAPDATSSLFWMRIGNNPGVAKSEPDKVTAN